MSKSKELSEFDRGSTVGCHLCGKSVHEIADILQKPKSTVRDVIGKWKFEAVKQQKNEPVGPKYFVNAAAELLKG
ncbi:hypothetical protein TNCV_3258811 [Trichonephila clavipes]|nr:hypothetical protein TNCV_3258811 [Trichonephila clavipes]